MINTLQYIPYQQELDERIFSNHHTTREATRHDRLCALLVELGEFANEMRAFKYWSLKPASAQHVLLEEYADGLHFLNSLCIDLNIAPIIQPQRSPLGVVALTLSAYEAIVACMSHFDEYHLILAYEAYAQLAYACEFTSEQLFEAYVSKHQKNHVRQDEHY
jgi:dimeric dUTPase (all-alpha-NTP-PPase superfamily)